MNNMYKRPMFRKGGSAEGGITSGLQSPRQGYAQPGTVKQNDSSRQRIMNAMGANPPKRNFYDFLTNFGLDIASRPSAGPGFGGLITTGVVMLGSFSFGIEIASASVVFALTPKSVLNIFLILANISFLLILLFFVYTLIVHRMLEGR